MTTSPTKLLCALAAVLLAAPARADSSSELVNMLNAWRAAPGNCEGRRVSPLPPLTAIRALTQMNMHVDGDPRRPLEQAGYQPRHAQGFAVSGATEARAVLAMLRADYCYMVLDARYSIVGAARSGDDWQIVFGQPLLPPTLTDAKDAGKAVLRAANAARARARNCGGRVYPAAPPMKWNPALGEAALAHSRDMAQEANLTHQGSDGSTVGQRLTRIGYRWGLAGENIHMGVGTPEEAVAGWVDSPGHCINLMNPTFTEMGAAYAVDRDRRGGNIYWTQVLSTPRQ